MKKIGLFVKQDPEAAQKADALERWLHERHIDVVRQESMPPGRKYTQHTGPDAPADLYCIFVLGGDGTFLSAVRWIGDQNIPILGVKFGDLGFLAETVAENLFSVADAVLNNEFITRPRMRLKVSVYRKKRKIACETVLNDVVVNKGALARLAHINTLIDDHYLTTYRADGLIIATPTGSTAYSLAAGGPIIHPQVPGIVMTPISPFTLTNRPLIVPDSVCINISIDEKSSDIMLTFDGQAGLEINHTDTIVVRKSAHPIHMLAIPGKEYFDVLKTKLRWSGGRV